MFSLQWTAHSEVGRVRKNNQDAAYASPTFLVVCDGMGGAAAGDLASAVAATVAKKADRRLTDPEDMLAAVAGAIARANNQLGDLIEEDYSIDGMGTTFCGAMCNGEQLAVGHIGDSRGYLLRDGELTQITHDHSWVQSLIDQGKITPEQAATHPHRSLILKVLNGQEGFDPDLFTLDLQLGDRILFCSDGLSGLVGDDDLRETLDSMGLDEAVDHLAQLANTNGGHDNITMVVAEVVEQDPELDAVPGQLYGSAVEVEIPAVGARAMSAGKASGYPEAKPATTPTATKATTLEPSEQAPDEAARYAPGEGRARWSGLLVGAIIVALFIGGGAWGLRTYADSRYFLAAEAGEINIYNGLPGSLLGMPLSEVAESTDVQVSDLPAFHQRAVRNTIAVSDIEAGRATVEELRALAERCVEVRDARLRPATPAPSPTPTALASSIPPLPQPTGSPAPNDVEPGYPTHLAPMTPTATAEADPESC